MSNDDRILEGFLCPICKADLKSPELLTNHVETLHSEEQDVLKSLKDMFISAKRKILSEEYNNSNSNNNNNNITETIDNAVKSVFNSVSQNNYALNSSASTAWIHNTKRVEQEIGPDCDHIFYFKQMRDPLLERYATETNRLIIRLDKLLKDRPTDSVQRKQHEQKLIPWIDGKLVNLCPSCAKKFHLARRQHHCRLCGSIMCDECSRFLSEREGYTLINPSKLQEFPIIDDVGGSGGSNQINNSLRICEHCSHLLDNRKEMQDSRCEALITIYYNKIQQIKFDIQSDIEMYIKMVNNLLDGDSILTIADATALHGKIARTAETIDTFSKKLVALNEPSGGQNDSLKKTIRLACIKYIQDELLSIPSVPSEQEILKLQVKRKRETEFRIERERHQKLLLATEKYELINDNNQNVNHMQQQSASGSAVTSLDNWSGRQASNSGGSTLNDPLIEQINIIKGYIKQARDALRFDEVRILETNLRELQQEFYQRQQSN